MMLVTGRYDSVLKIGQISTFTMVYLRYIFLIIWCWNLVPILPGAGFFLHFLVFSEYFFSLKDAPNVLHR